jgi:hypothetical protein
VTALEPAGVLPPALAPADGLTGCNDVVGPGWFI